MNSLRFITATLVLGFGSPAFADLSVDDAWAIWQAQARAFGLTLAAEETRDGEALEIGGITLGASLPMDAGTFEFNMEGPRFEPAGNGDVRVVFPDSSEINIVIVVMDEEPITARFEISGLGTGLMSGSANDVVSEWRGDAAVFSFGELVQSDQHYLDGSLELSVEDVEVTTRTVIADGRVSIKQEKTFGTYNYSYDLTVPGYDGTRNVETGVGNDVTVRASLSLPQDGVDVYNLHTEMRDGLSLTFETSGTGGHSEAESYLDGTLISRDNAVFGENSGFYAIDGNGVTMRGVFADFVMELDDVEIGVPLGILGHYGELFLQFPLMASETPRPVTFLMTLDDWGLTESTWALFDPGVALPRDPMNMVMDFSGEIILEEDLLNFSALADLGPDDSPVIPVSFELRELVLRAMGVDLSGSGHIAFDPTDTETYPGYPRPDGKLELNVSGLSRLLDTLNASGIESEENIMGIRMLMGMFTRPGDGEDTLTSTLEMTEDGRILANGMRLK